MNLLLIRIRKLLHALLSAPGRRALRLGVAASIEHSAALKRRDFRTVVDIGANVGQFALFASERYPNANIFSFEPLEDCWSVFDKIFGGNDRVRLFRYAIGPYDGQASINVTSENDSSSILAPAQTQAEVFGTKVKTEQKIEIRRLGSVISEGEIIQPALLKIDVQGFELEVLKGCGHLLDLFNELYVEASYVELYKGQPLAGEVIDFLRSRGFEIRGVFNQHVDNLRGPLQADFLFKKTREPLSMPG